MEKYPDTLEEFEKWFATEEACIEYLFKLRWPNGFICPKCASSNAWRTSRGIWACQHCNANISVTSGTIFHGTRKPLRLWFRTMWHITAQKYGANALGLKRIIEPGCYETSWQWLHKLRRAMIRPGRDRLSGCIQVDETYVGGRKKGGKRGRGAEGKALVIVGVEELKPKGIGRIRLKHVSDASAESLEVFVQEMIEPGSTIRTDGWKGYTRLREIGYKHEVLPSMELKLPHLVASLLKRWLLGTYQGAVKPTHLSYYLDEFTFRFNRRSSKSRGKLFYRLVQQALMTDPVTESELKAEIPMEEDFDDIEI